jgi:hypothetical protein
MPDPAFPEVDTDPDGWRLVEESVETLFKLPATEVRGSTRRYEDDLLRQAVREATGDSLDREWRFLSATRMGFVPSLPPGTPAAALLGTVQREARDAFVDRLSRRGLADVERTADERIRVRSGARARLTRYRARDQVDGRDLPVAGWVGVWHDGGDFFVVTGGYPDCRLSDVLGVDDSSEQLSRSAADFRDEFVELLRTVR